MSIQLIPANTSDATLAPIYQQIKQALGTVPNLAQVLGNSPAALQGWLGLNGALQQGNLPAQLREQIALAIAEQNECDYCLAAHSTLSNLAGLSQDEQLRARLGTSSDAYAIAAINLAVAINRDRGHVGEEELAVARRAGLDDAAIVEITVSVALNILTNYVNHIAQTAIDFPAAPELRQTA
jgi:AhpD family alkylhydroperoxidase